MHITPNLVNQTETKEEVETQQSCHAQINSPNPIQTIDLPAIWVEDREDGKRKMSRLQWDQNKCRKDMGRRKKMSRLVPQTRAAVLFLQKTS